MNKCEISKASLGRIPMYIEYIDSLEEDMEYISSGKIARGLGLGEVQVRKDLSLFCKNGKPKIGYEKAELKKCLASYLNYDDGTAIIIGAGKLGKALVDYTGFESYGTKILCAFDSAVENEVVLDSGRKVYPMERLYDFCAEHKVKIGIIATPVHAAQEVLDKLYECGIRLVWCFAPCKLTCPKDMIIQYENLALSLAHLKLQSN